MMGASSIGMSSPSQTSLAVEGGAAVLVPGGVAVPRVRPRRAFLPRIRRHPYVRLALNASFSALWVGQVISLFGDRVNQIALGAFVYEVHRLPARGGPDLLRGDASQPRVLAGRGRIRGPLGPEAGARGLGHPASGAGAADPGRRPRSTCGWRTRSCFLITTVSIFFRPARITILPRLVRERDLLSANSAMWVGETLADVVNYPIAGLFVVYLAASLPIAFWFDAATYLVSAGAAVGDRGAAVVRKARGAAGAGPGPRRGGTTVRGPRRRRHGGRWGAWDRSSTRSGNSKKPLMMQTRDARGRSSPTSRTAAFRHEAVLLVNTIQGTAGRVRGRHRHGVQHRAAKEIMICDEYRRELTRSWRP